MNSRTHRQLTTSGSGYSATISGARISSKLLDVNQPVGLRFIRELRLRLRLRFIRIPIATVSMILRRR